jgi:hydrogenase nickel incorporation protein HypB
MSPRIIEVRQRILKKNDELARGMREEFSRCGVYVVNLVSGPGAGKTELLKHTLTALNANYRTAAVVGDLATENDARRLAASGSPVRQILTGTTCHLDAEMVRGAISDWNLNELDFLFIENVGNLVCPSSWDLGEDLRGLLFAVTEGEDKPLKYPTLINTADVVLLSKMDLAAAVDCDLAAVWRNVEMARPGVEILQVSARTGTGMAAWIDFLKARLELKRNLPSTMGASDGQSGLQRASAQETTAQETTAEKIYIG